MATFIVLCVQQDAGGPFASGAALSEVHASEQEAIEAAKKYLSASAPWERALTDLTVCEVGEKVWPRVYLRGQRDAAPHIMRAA